MNTIDVSRYEFKYLLTPPEVPDVRRFLRRYCAPDSNAEGEEWYGIRSLYLDTPDYRFFSASKEKAAERLKIRVRAYTNGTGPVKLEIKRRTGDVVWKRSLVTAYDFWNRVASRGNPSLRLDPESSATEFVRLVEQMRATPKVLVTYDRHALHSTVDDYVRVTFDRQILCQPMREWQLHGNPRAWRAVDDPPSFREDTSTYVLELKFKTAPPGWLHDMVTAFGLVRRGFSKYARAVQRIRAEREPAWDLRTPGLVPAWAWRVA
jgi:SPX domain protein involved in polyphosphate accumulation